jgi:dienelactone hydrolase
MRLVVWGWMVVVAALLSACAGDFKSTKDIGGVPLPEQVFGAEPADASDRNDLWRGAWIGAWGGVTKHILLVENVDQNGNAAVLYAVGDHPRGRFKRQWQRITGRVSDDVLSIHSNNLNVKYRLANPDTLHGLFAPDRFPSAAALKRHNLEELADPAFKPLFTSYETAKVPTELVEGSKTVFMEMVTFKPPGTGPFPLAVINHGSTGTGKNPIAFDFAWWQFALARHLTDRGWLVAFPQRRGRGGSDGLYDEGFNEDRAQGYTCEQNATLAGAERASIDLGAAIKALRKRPDVAQGPVLLAGQSRGGALSVAYAGAHPDQVYGVINFVGGWLADLCDTATSVHAKMLGKGARFRKPMLWLYGADDPFYTVEHTRAVHAAFTRKGGQAEYLLFYQVLGGNGHFLIAHEHLWGKPVSDYLGRLKAEAKPQARAANAAAPSSSVTN